MAPSPLPPENGQDALRPGSAFFSMRKRLPLLLLLCLLTACLSPPGTSASPPGSAIDKHPWASALRALDPPDTANPAGDLTAVYLRRAGEHLQIRVDLLDFRSANDLSLEIQIGDDSSPEATPLTVRIPSRDSQARITLDPLLATVIIDVRLSEVPSHPRVDVSTPQDQLNSLTLDGPVPPQTAPLLLTFYDTFAARFPAEALRNWDGAHSGPRGERHGLKHLLEASEEYQAPMVLLDLKKPESLSALDAMGVLPKIQQLEQNGLLILPDGPEQEALFGLSSSPFQWGGIPPVRAESPPGRDGLWDTLASRPAFVFSKDPRRIYQPLFRKMTYIPIASESDTNQPTSDGPSLEVRRALLDVALNGDETDLLVLGGSLRDSTWGGPEMAGATLAYFTSRPYIRILSGDDLLTFPTKRGKPEIQSLPRDEPIHGLESHYQNLTQPVLEFVANWQGSPLSSCETDLDKDNQPECVLANDKYLAILDPQGARLTYLFAVGWVGREASPKGGNPPYTQLIGPSWQVAVGLSNASLWDLSAGEAADPGAYPGAFADTDGLFKPYEPAVAGNSIVFTSLDGRRAKTFTLTETGIEVGYQIREPVTTQISLLVEPGTRFTSGWAEKYVQEKTPGGIAWGLENGPMVSVQAEGAISLQAFNESLPLLASPEDPDFEYPPGHTIPFPMAVAEVEVQDGYFLLLEGLP